MQTHIHFLEQRLKATSTDLRDTVQASPVWRAQDNLLQSVPGIGPTTAATLIAAPPRTGPPVAPADRRLGRRRAPQSR